MRIYRANVLHAKRREQGSIFLHSTGMITFCPSRLLNSDGTPRAHQVFPPRGACMHPSSIKAIRQNLGWSQAALGAHCGVTRREVIFWENGERQPHLKRLRQIRALEYDLLRLTDEWE